MTTINQASLLRGSGPTLLQVEITLQDVAYNTGNTLRVTQAASGTTVNGKPISQLIPATRVTEDTVAFSPAATSVLSNQQVALNVIQYSENRTGHAAAPAKAPNSVAPTSQQAAVPSAPSQDAQGSADTLGEPFVAQDPAALIGAYMAESPTERFYSSSADPGSISDQFFSSPEQQASYIAAYNSGGLTIRSISDFTTGDVESTTSFVAGGMSSGPSSGSGHVDLSSIKDDNILTFDDPVAGGIVVSWNNAQG